MEFRKQKIDGAAGRVRGHSLLSALKVVSLNTDTDGGDSHEQEQTPIGRLQHHRQGDDTAKPTPDEALQHPHIGGTTVPRSDPILIKNSGSPRFRMARRSTLADKLELDAILKKSMVQHNKHKYLPLTATTIHRLSPFWKGAKPIADMKIFDCIKIGHEINNVHADHAVAALGRIGEHCTHLLVVAPIQTSELGNVFNREEGNVAFSNDWEQILRCFPNLKWLAFVHPQDVPTRFSLATFHALRTAIVNHQSALALGKFEVNIPPAVLANFAHNVAPAPTN